ncbi:hypothetical protein FOL47_004828 [Perkinsus chesapeaki]|uniref:Uncharacterized protein n=1 Tax=Perkinsus chesapeaki TaxID=330153 RepID=A0A7J6M0F1_PERCH|nr:hypothetical protein FOL47_004828 [Perkinsus chesapeaki]
MTLIPPINTDGSRRTDALRSSRVSEVDLLPPRYRPGHKTVLEKKQAQRRSGWDDRFYLGKIPEYDPLRDANCGAYRAMLRRKRERASTGRRTFKASARGVSAITRGSHRAPTVIKQNTSPILPDNLKKREQLVSQLAHHIRECWRAFRIPENHRKHYAQSFFHPGTHPSFLLAEADRLARDASSVQNVMRAVMGRESVIHKLDEIDKVICEQPNAVNSAALRSEILSNLLSLREASMETVEAIVNWRQSLVSHDSCLNDAPSERPIWQHDETGTNYLIKIKTDTLWLGDASFHRLFAFSSRSDPFLVSPSVASPNPVVPEPASARQRAAPRRAPRAIHVPLHKDQIDKIRKCEMILLDESVLNHAIEQAAACRPLKTDSLPEADLQESPAEAHEHVPKFSDTSGSGEHGEQHIEGAHTGEGKTLNEDKAPTGLDIFFKPARCTSDVMRAEFANYISTEADPMSVASTRGTWDLIDRAIYGSTATSKGGAEQARFVQEEALFFLFYQASWWWIHKQDGSRIGLIVYNLKFHLLPQIHVHHISVIELSMIPTVLTNLRRHIFERYPEVGTIRATIWYTERDEVEQRYSINRDIETAFKETHFRWYQLTQETDGRRGQVMNSRRNVDELGDPPGLPDGDPVPADGVLQFQSCIFALTTASEVSPSTSAMCEGDGNPITLAYGLIKAGLNPEELITHTNTLTSSRIELLRRLMTEIESDALAGLPESHMASRFLPPNIDTLLQWASERQVLRSSTLFHTEVLSCWYDFTAGKWRDALKDKIAQVANDESTAAREILAVRASLTVHVPYLAFDDAFLVTESSHSYLLPLQFTANTGDSTIFFVPTSDEEIVLAILPCSDGLPEGSIFDITIKLLEKATADESSAYTHVILPQFQEEHINSTHGLQGVRIRAGVEECPTSEENKISGVVEFARLSLTSDVVTDRSSGFLQQSIKESRVGRISSEKPFIVALCHAALDDLNIPLHASLVCPVV